MDLWNKALVYYWGVYSDNFTFKSNILAFACFACLGEYLGFWSQNDKFRSWKAYNINAHNTFSSSKITF